MLAIFNQLPSGAHVNGGSDSGVKMVQCSSCAMELGKPGVVNVDGEIVKHDGTLNFEVSNLFVREPSFLSIAHQCDGFVSLRVWGWFRCYLRR